MTNSVIIEPFSAFCTLMGPNLNLAFDELGDNEILSVYAALGGHLAYGFMFLRRAAERYHYAALASAVFARHFLTYR